MLCMCRMTYFTVNIEHFLIKSSLYTDVLFFLSVISRTQAKRGHENECRARERKIKNVCRHLWRKKGLSSPSPMSKPYHYHLCVRCIFSSSPTTTPLHWWSINSPAVYILSRVLDRLKRENRRSVNRLHKI